MGTHTLLDCSKRYGKLKKFIHFSTDEVYGEVDINHIGCTEASILNPTNPYSATKASAEFLVRSYGHSFKLPYVIIRCNNVYGENQYPEKLIPKFIHLLKLGEKCPIHGTGQTRRNFIHAYDVATAVDIILKKAQVNDIVNIGTSNEFSVMEIVKILVKEIKGCDEVDSYIEYVDDRPFNDYRYNISSNKLKEYGWMEEVKFLEGIKSLV